MYIAHIYVDSVYQQSQKYEVTCALILHYTASHPMALLASVPKGFLWRSDSDLGFWEAIQELALALQKTSF
jgi:hypothetical protein